MIINVTGHRPDKLKGGYSWETEENKELLENLKVSFLTILNSLKEDEPLEIMFGGALGIDQMSFEAAYKLKMEGYNIILTLCIPFRNQYIKWFKDSIKIYKHQLGVADNIIYVDELTKYNPSRDSIGDYKIWKLQKRNEYMVDHSDLVLAYWDGSSGGTKNCIKYAIDSGVKVVNILTGELLESV